MRLFFDTDGISRYDNIIFLAHSMGGLAVRAYLLKNRDVASKTRLTYFYSTPSDGSEIASLATLISKNPQLAKMKPVQSADYLGDQQRQWLAANFNIPSFCAYETQPTYGFSIVTFASASKLCNRRLDPINANHISIAKPDGVRDPIYLAFKSAVMQTPEPPNIEDGVIRKSKRSISHQKMLDLQGYVSHLDNSTHTAFINMAARFRDPQFNNGAYFASLNLVEAYLENERNDRDPIRIRANDCSIKDGSELRCLLALEFEGSPPLGARLTIKLGPSTHQQVISQSTFDWVETKFEKFDDKIPWWVSESDVVYNLDHPNWLVLTDAELLAGPDGVSLVKISISNPTDTAASIQRVELIAFEDLELETGVNCNTGDPIQTVVLKWDLVRSGAKDAITTFLSGVDLPVHTRYNFIGVCNQSYSIEANVPVSEMIQSHSNVSLTLRVKELPPRKQVANRSSLFGGISIPGRFGSPPDRLGDWPNLDVGLTSDPASVISPTKIVVRKPANSDRVVNPEKNVPSGKGHP